MMAKKIIDRERGSTGRDMSKLRTEIGSWRLRVPSRIGSLGNTARSYTVTLALQEFRLRLLSWLLTETTKTVCVSKVPFGLSKDLKKYLELPCFREFLTHLSAK